MAFEGLTSKISAAFSKLRSKGKLTEQAVKGAMREIRMALLEAAVNYAVVKDFIKKVTDKAVGADILESLTPGQQVIKIVKDGAKYSAVKYPNGKIVETRTLVEGSRTAKNFLEKLHK